MQEEDPERLIVIQSDGSSLTIAKSEIEERVSGNSVMPSNVLQRLGLGEIRDLVEYLATRK